MPKPERLKLKDMPRHDKRALGGLSQTLSAALNDCRDDIEKLESLRTLLAYTLDHIDQTQETSAIRASARVAENARITAAIEAGEDPYPELTAALAQAEAAQGPK